MTFLIKTPFVSRKNVIIDLIYFEKGDKIIYIEIIPI